MYLVLSKFCQTFIFLMQLRIEITILDDLGCESWFVSQASLQNRDVSSSGRVVSIRAQVTTEAPAKVEKESKKQDEGVVVNKFKPKTPYVGRCLLNTKITGDDAPGETWHMVFSTEGWMLIRFPSIFLSFLLLYPPKSVK